MEFSGMVFVSQNWFSMYSGQPDSWLTLITAHEVSHQWWYSLVGNDQGNEPYLDEALAVYSESLYMENYYPKLLPWWWNFRVKSYAPQGSVDSKVFDFQNLRLYLNAVYLRGALMLQDIRTTIGDDDFLKWLHDYRTAYAGKIATAVDLWSTLSPADYVKTAPVRSKYLHNPDPLNLLTATTAATEVATQSCCG
jgi:aminopeptidase N